MVKIIAEIGINHGGNIKTAKKLIDASEKAGCWGIKFQYRDTKSFYLQTSEIGDEILLEELKRVNLSVENIKLLLTYAKNRNLKCGVSFFRVEDAKKFISTCSFADFYKIPSAECMNSELIDYLVREDKEVIISTGGHLEADIKVQAQRYQSNEKISFLHCIANYPSRTGAQNLNFINRLKSYGLSKDRIGYSSHDENYEVCFVALGIGAKIIERHITLNKNGGGLDDSSSSEPFDFHILCKFGKEIDGLIGTGEKKLNQGEITNIQNLGTGVYVTRDIEKGDIINKEDILIRAPRTGLSTEQFFKNYIHKPVQKTLLSGSVITSYDYDYNNTKPLISDDLIEFCRLYSLGIPVRIHDFQFFKEKIDCGYYEFHLSYGEVEKLDLIKIKNIVDNNDQYSIHLPDYIYGNLIMDPISNNDEIRNESKKLIDRVLNMKSIIEQKIQKEVPVVGSFSRRQNGRREETLTRLFEYIDSLDYKSQKIIPQWLPVYAWYFGGSERLRLFNSIEDIEYVKKFNRMICLDICHLVLSANAHKANWKDWYNKVHKQTRHIHLANAHGIDGEGLNLENGDIKDFDFLMRKPFGKIIEVWQGHLNQGFGFINALKYLKENFENN